MALEQLLLNQVLCLSISADTLRACRLAATDNTSAIWVTHTVVLGRASSI